MWIQTSVLHRIMKNAFNLKKIPFSSRLFLLLIINVLLVFIPNSTSSAQSSGKLDTLKTELKKHTVKDTAYLKDLIFLASQQRNENIELSQGYYNEALSI